MQARVEDFLLQRGVLESSWLRLIDNVVWGMRGDVDVLVGGLGLKMEGEKEREGLSI